MTLRKLPVAAGFLALIVGCSAKQTAQLSGQVTFKGQPVPAGWIAFTPDVAAGGRGQIRVLQVKDGAFDSAKEDPPGIEPGVYLIRIAGFDGKRIPFYGQGKQIFNPVDDKFTVPPGTTTKDFVIPESAGHNVKIQPTADS